MKHWYAMIIALLFAHSTYAMEMEAVDAEYQEAMKKHLINAMKEKIDEYAPHFSEQDLWGLYDVIWEMLYSYQKPNNSVIPPLIFAIQKNIEIRGSAYSQLEAWELLHKFWEWDETIKRIRESNRHPDDSSKQEKTSEKKSSGKHRLQFWKRR